jgi:hypothetical protein
MADRTSLVVGLLALVAAGLGLLHAAGVLADVHVDGSVVGAVVLVALGVVAVVASVLSLRGRRP